MAITHPLPKNILRKSCACLRRVHKRLPERVADNLEIFLALIFDTHTDRANFWWQGWWMGPLDALLHLCILVRSLAHHLQNFCCQDVVNYSVIMWLKISDAPRTCKWQKLGRRDCIFIHENCARVLENQIFFGEKEHPAQKRVGFRTAPTVLDPQFTRNRIASDMHAQA